jgi:hypothetical protein
MGIVAAGQAQPQAPLDRDGTRSRVSEAELVMRALVGRPAVSSLVAGPADTD